LLPTIAHASENFHLHRKSHTSSFVTPMGNEMFYRYQQSLIDEAITTLGSLLHNTGGNYEQASHRVN
jgi:hypothetical protein